MKQLSMPFQVGWDITHLCNFRCKHCYFTAEQLADRNCFSREQALSFVRHLAVKKVFHLSLAGGEPLLYPHIVDVVKAATTGGMLVAMSTNASLLTKALASELWDAGLRSIQISLDGSTAEINDSIRGSGKYAQTVSGIQVAKEQGFSVFLALVLVEQNINDIFEYVALAIKLGVRGIKVQTLIDCGLGHENLKQLQANEEVLRRVIRDLWAFKREVAGQIELMLPLIPEVLETARGEEEYYYRESSCLGCQPGLSTIRVNAHGDVRACGGFVDVPPVGNVLQSSLQAIWLESREIARWRNESQVIAGLSNGSCGSICGKGCRSTTAPDFAKT
jgi:radical SAM protein with 4Fe4S-binding SPASM domain